MPRTKTRTTSHPNLKISDADLEALRREYRQRHQVWGIKTALAEKYGVSVPRICALVKDIDEEL